MAVRIFRLGIKSLGLTEYEHFLNGWNMKFWKFEILENVRVPFFKKTQKMVFEKSPVLPGSKIPLLAIHKIISHIWEDGSRKVNNDEPDLRFFHGNF